MISFDSLAMSQKYYDSHNAGYEDGENDVHVSHCRIAILFNELVRDRHVCLSPCFSGSRRVARVKEQVKEIEISQQLLEGTWSPLTGRKWPRSKIGLLTSALGR